MKNPFGDFGKKKKNKQSSGGGSGAGGGGGGGGNPEQEKQRLLATAALLMAVLTARSVFEDDGPGNGREVRCIERRKSWGVMMGTLVLGHRVDRC